MNSITRFLLFLIVTSLFKTVFASPVTITAGEGDSCQPFPSLLAPNIEYEGCYLLKAPTNSKVILSKYLPPNVQIIPGSLPSCGYETIMPANGECLIRLKLTTSGCSGTIIPKIQACLPGGLSCAQHVPQLQVKHGVPFISSVVSECDEMGMMGVATPIMIIGANFNSVTEVNFGAAGSIPFKIESDSQITATTPVYNRAGPVSVTVKTPSGISNSRTFTFVDPATAPAECSNM